MYEDVLSEEGTVVVLIDMQSGFLEGLNAKKRANMVSNQRLVLTQSISLGVPISVLEYYKWGHTISELRKELRKDPNCAFFTKRKDSGFSEAPFIGWLKRQGAARLFLMGVNASACVRATAADALSEGYDIVTSQELIAKCPNDNPDCYIDWYMQNGRLLSATSV